MIDLSCNRTELLAEIEAAEPTGEPLNDLTDPRVASADACVRVHGRAKKDLFPLLKVALSERFAAVPRLQLIRDLLIPLRNLLGNAYKHGNARNPAKSLCVELVLARGGALIAVTDQGSGFDVALTFRRSLEQEDYFENRGAGFRNLHQATSTVSYENGGRTALLCFRPTIPASDPLGDSFAKALDSEWTKTSLSAELPEFANGRARLESCRVYATRGPACDGCGNRYVLRVAGRDGQPADTRILTGRLHATEAAAAADFEAAKKLHAAATLKRSLIPNPVARLAGEPRLVLYDFDPWMNLWEYLRYRGNLNSLRHAAERIGQALAGLHRSRIVLGGMENDISGNLFSAMVARAETNLSALPGGPGLVNRCRLCVERIQDWDGLRRHHNVAPIHGALGWDCIHYGVDGRFYLYRFEACRRSDPGLDLGGFTADLLCFTLANYDEETYRKCHDTFLNNYNSNSEHSMDEDALRFHIALALVERLQRAESRTMAGQQLDALNAALSNRHVESVVML